MHITKWNNVKTCELLSLKVSGWRKDFKSNFSPKKNVKTFVFKAENVPSMWDSFLSYDSRSILQKMTPSSFVDVVNKVIMRHNGLHARIQKFWDPYLILGVLSFPLLACILATLKTALYMKLYTKRPLYIDHLSL